MIEPATIPGFDNGRYTVRNTVNGVAPKLLAAGIRRVSIFAMAE
ncbi:hypothetical protein CVCC1112_3039 [Paenarthrobacter nicotinovorans]|nr:hypothetical protein CVCC1112_3039 [Paenarthrobacter nicotinovorans]